MPISPEVLQTLCATPAEVARLVAAVPPARLRQRAASGHFAALEHACHLADIEDEYALRVRRLLTEQDPLLPDFDGDRIATERRYLEQPLPPALERLRAGRERLLTQLRGLSEAQLARGGRQEQVGPVDVARLASALAEHDLGHLEELRALVAELGGAQGTP